MAPARRRGALSELPGKETVQRWQAWARTGQLAPLFEELMRLHYDPHYGRSQARNYAQWQARRVVAATDLSDAAIERLAQTVSASA